MKEIAPMKHSNQTGSKRSSSNKGTKLNWLSIPQNRKKVNTPPTKASPFASPSSAFTIVELLIVIVIIAILAAITIISYTGISNRAKLSSLKTELSQASKKLETEKVQSATDTYPSSTTAAGITQPKNITYTYTGGGTTTYCLEGKYENYTYHVSSTDTSPTEGACPVVPFASGSAIQTATTANCPSARTLAVDARDNRTYWIQKLADGKCWMLTNLAYAGGGTNTYNDVMPTGDGTSGTLSGPDNAGSTTYTNAKYYIPDGANPTTAPTEPSTSTDGGATGKQYGYLYNFCAANRGQTGNGACTDSSSTAVDTTKSICPAGWRLPTGASSGEFAALNTAINGGSTSSPSGLLATWLAQYGGGWYGGFFDPGSYGLYWSSTQYGSYSAYFLYFSSSVVYPSYYSGKNYGRAVRCLVS